MVLGKRARMGGRKPYAKRKYRRTQTDQKYPRQFGPGYQPGTQLAARGPELMHYTTGLNLTALNTAPASTNPALYQVTSLNNIAQGDAGDGRKGNKIRLRRITIRVKVEVDPNSDGVYTNLVANAHVFRVVLYLDTRMNGASPNWTDMFDSNPTNMGQLYDYNNPYVCNRFKILVDKFITVPPSYMIYDGTNYHSGGNCKFFKASIPLDCSTWFSDGTNNLSAIQENNLGMWIASDASSTAYPTMKFSYRSKLRYNDY